MNRATDKNDFEIGEFVTLKTVHRNQPSDAASTTEADGKMYVKYQVIGKNNVAVPTHFFKVVILEKRSGEVELRSYVMPNTPVDENTPLERFLVPIESIERASGLLFVPNVMKRTSSLRATTAAGK
ncbi:UNVERIFIED_CONTAM: hypothetical protein FKN15_053788 [Acipenser sinensis]